MYNMSRNTPSPTKPFGNLWKSKRNNVSLILMEEGGDDTDNV